MAEKFPFVQSMQSALQLLQPNLKTTHYLRPNGILSFTENNEQILNDGNRSSLLATGLQYFKMILLTFILFSMEKLPMYDSS